MNNDLISREALKKTIIEICGKCSNIITKYENGVPDGNCAIQHILNIIDNAPTVEPKQGEWIDDKEYSYLANCSNCGYQMDTHEEHGYFKFCPNCGADMQKGGAE